MAVNRERYRALIDKEIETEVEKYQEEFHSERYDISDENCSEKKISALRMNLVLVKKDVKKLETKLKTEKNGLRRAKSSSKISSVSNDGEANRKENKSILERDTLEEEDDARITTEIQKSED